MNKIYAFRKDDIELYVLSHIIKQSRFVHPYVCLNFLINTKEFDADFFNILIVLRVGFILCLLHLYVAGRVVGSH